MGKKSKKKRRADEAAQERSLPRRNTAIESIAGVLSGSNAKWLFFGIYLLLTIILFRDFLFSGDMLFGSDTIPDGIYTRKYYKEYNEQFGGIPRWNPFLLGGLPFIDAMHGDTFYPAAWLKFFIPLTRALGHKLVWHVFLAGIFMYIFLRTLKLRKEAAFLGGLMYMLAPSFVSWLYGGHDAKMYVIALLPLAFTFLERGMEKPKFLTFTALGAVMGLLILTSHIQMAYYSYWAIGLYFVYRMFAPRIDSMRGIGLRASLFVMAVLIAVTFGAVQLLPAYKYSTSQSVRAGSERTGYDYATSFSMNAEEVISMTVPSFSGAIDGRFDKDTRKNLYWGKNGFKINTEYHGIIPLVFAVLALFMCRSRLKWFFLGLATLSLIYAVGSSTPFYRFFYALVPGVKNFRAPSMIIYLFGFSAVTLAAQFISSLLDSKTSLKPGDRRLIFAVLAIVVVSVIVSLMDTGFFNNWKNVFYRSIPDSSLQKMNANVRFFIADLWRVVVIASAALLGIWMFLSRKIGTAAIVLLFAITMISDSLYVDSKFITVIDPDTYPGSAPDNTVRELQQRLAASPMPFRVLGSFSGKSQNYYAMFGIQAANGMHNNELQSYERFKGGGLIENYIDKWIIEGSLEPEGLPKNNFLKVAGVRYIILQGQQGQTQYFENVHALDRAYIVHEAVGVPRDEDAIEMLKRDDFNPAKTVIVSGNISLSSAGLDSLSTVDSYEVLRNGFALGVTLERPGVVVITENMVPFWHAALDGNPVTVHKAYGTFMAVECPAGTHEITFTFRSAPYETGKNLTLASLAFIVVSFVSAGIFRTVKRTKERT